MTFTTFLKELEADVKSGLTSTKNELVIDIENLSTSLKTDLTPAMYAILQSAVAAAEVTGGAWNVKLLAATTTAVSAFAKNGLPIILNDIVGAITAIVNQMNAAKNKLATAAAPSSTNITSSAS